MTLNPLKNLLHERINKPNLLCRVHRATYVAGTVVEGSPVVVDSPPWAAGGSPPWAAGDSPPWAAGGSPLVVGSLAGRGRDLAGYNQPQLAQTNNTTFHIVIT